MPINWASTVSPTLHELTFVTPFLAPFKGWKSSVFASVSARSVYVHPPVRLTRLIVFLNLILSYKQWNFEHI